MGLHLEVLLMANATAGVCSVKTPATLRRTPGRRRGYDEDRDDEAKVLVRSACVGDVRVDDKVRSEMLRVRRGSVLDRGDAAMHQKEREGAR